MVSWVIIFYSDDDRSIVGPYTSLRDAEKDCRSLDGYGDLEIRRVETLDRTLAALERD